MLSHYHELIYSVNYYSNRDANIWHCCCSDQQHQSWDAKRCTAIVFALCTSEIVNTGPLHLQLKTRLASGG